MGNLFVLCKPAKKSPAGAVADNHSKVLRIVKVDGKILQLTSPTTVKDLLVKYPGMGVAVSKKSTQHLPPTHQLKIGKKYYLLPSPISSEAETEQAGGTRRIKLVITKQQLQQLLTKQASFEDILLRVEKTTCSSVDKPKLETIPEGSELLYWG
ncbi:hypothetical protein NMG60_11020077 [Bertholletia excelsa]